MTEKAVLGLTREQEDIFVSYFAYQILKKELRVEARRVLSALRDWTALQAGQFALESSNVVRLESKRYPRIRARYTTGRKAILWSISAANYAGTQANAKIEVLPRMWSRLEQAGILDEVTRIWTEAGGRIFEESRESVHQMKISQELDEEGCARVVAAVSKIRDTVAGVV